jgi:DNA polymerase-3 subunit gamma/tau
MADDLTVNPHPAHQDGMDMAENEPGLFGMEPVKPSNSAAYRVLARKYRPSHFGDLIGQEAMVRTLTNAFAAGRIPQAWMLTGVRGVGKTTTARIVARALNYRNADGSGGPTTALETLGIDCQAIIDGRHIDVMEIDAASNNGVDNVRQITDAVRYAPVSARYKVYIIDEVHMLSGAAFNAFLKTLEEPPPHAKFILATTEIRKVPVTILSRCQRFDLKRVDAGVLVEHLTRICAAEGVNAETEALVAIARAAEGSVRDSLSILDQAITHAEGTVSAADVRDMLGLADRARVVGLFESVMRGDMQAALAELRAQYDFGADPVVILNDLAEFTHLVTRLKLVADAAKDPALTQVERTQGADFASKLSIRALARVWQMLVRGIAEVKLSDRPLAASEMVLVRLAHAADLPTPDEALRILKEAGGSAPVPRSAIGQTAGPGAASRGVSAGPSRPVLAHSNAGSALLQQPPVAASNPAPALPKVASFADIVALASQNRDVSLKVALERDVRLVSFEQGRIELAIATGGSSQLATNLSRRLKEWTGQTWMVAVSAVPQGETAQPTLREQKEAEIRKREGEAARHPAVQAVLSQFPGARIVEVRDPRAVAAAEAEAEALTATGSPARDAIIEGGDVLPGEENAASDDIDF